jgi:glucose dehydrogenase
MSTRTIVAVILVAACAGLMACTSTRPLAERRSGGSTDWPGYNRTLTSKRFADLKLINRSNVAALRPICTCDLGLLTSFQTGPIVVKGTLYATSEKQMIVRRPSLRAAMYPRRRGYRAAVAGCPAGCDEQSRSRI